MVLSYYGSDEEIRSFMVKKAKICSGKDHIKDCYTFNGTVKIETNPNERIIIKRNSNNDIISIEIVKLSATEVNKG